MHNRRFTLYRYREIVENLLVLLDRVKTHAFKTTRTPAAADLDEDEEDDSVPGSKGGKISHKFKAQPLRQALLVNPILIPPAIIKFTQPHASTRPKSAPSSAGDAPPPVPTSVPSRNHTLAMKRRKEGSLSSSSSSGRSDSLVQTALTKPTLSRQISDALETRVLARIF